MSAFWKIQLFCSSSSSSMGTGAKGLRASMRFMYQFYDSTCFSFIDLDERALLRSLSYLSSTCQVTHNAPVKKRVIMAICLFYLMREAFMSCLRLFVAAPLIRSQVAPSHSCHLLVFVCCPCRVRRSIVLWRFLSALSASMRLRISSGDSLFLLDIIIIDNLTNSAHYFFIMQQQEEPPLIRQRQQVGLVGQKEEPLFASLAHIQQPYRVENKMIDSLIKAKECGWEEGNAISVQLQQQQTRINQIINYLVQQNQQLSDYQQQFLYKLTQNTKNALRQQLTQINKQNLKELKDIKNTNTKILQALITQEKRIGKLEAALEKLFNQLSS